MPRQNSLEGVSNFEYIIDSYGEHAAVRSFWHKNTLQFRIPSPVKNHGYSAQGAVAGGSPLEVKQFQSVPTYRLYRLGSL